MNQIHANIQVSLSHMPLIFDSHSDYGCWTYYEDQMRLAPSLTEHAQRVQAGGIGMEVLVIGGQSVLDEVDFRTRDTVLTAMQSVRMALSDPCLGYTQVLNRQDLARLPEPGRVGWTFGFEGAAPITSLDDLWKYHEVGLRVLSLTHAGDNDIACGRDREPGLGGGLTAFGRELVKALDDLPIVIDLAHLTDRGVMDTLELINRPVIISHTGARAVCDRPRNIPDDIIRSVAARGGVIGIFAVGYYLHDGEGAATAEAWLRHIEHVVELVGPEHVGLGTDFTDYMSEIFDRWHIPHLKPTVAGVPDCSHTKVFLEMLAGRGYDKHVIGDMAWKNFARVYDASLPRD